MPKPSFTPGPWHITECLDYWVHADGEALVAHCGDIDWPDFREKQFEWLANAHLIAAAPELFDACAEFVRKVEAGEARSTRSYGQMKAALARARGETQ